MTLTQAEMEARYDAERAGSLYVKPAGDLITAALEYIVEVKHDDELAIAAWIDQQITVEHGEVEGDVTYSEYRAGEVVICVQHNGYVPSGQTATALEICGTPIDACWTRETLQQMQADLGRLLNDARVVAALEAESEDTDGIITLLENCERTGIDSRFDRVVDAVVDLPDALRERAISMWEGFLDGIKAAVLVDWEHIKEMPIDIAVDTFGVEAISAAVKAHRLETAPLGASK